ncbi:expressed unknown protein [Seminavis robusta]|uniref:Uncharacterized protein n=1 Tax=Seminavis robusta TaxID=568900 RepID=A0A9N8HIJ4_9STRA|nr:expressed unknown protein [Seminavis robusta]|eukprot:Sro701_g189740.1 n/a (436) ;mRNA; r:4855-6162
MTKVPMAVALTSSCLLLNPALAFVPQFPQNVITGTISTRRPGLVLNSSDSSDNFDFDFYMSKFNLDLDFDSREAPKRAAEVYAAARKGLGMEDKHFLESSFFSVTPLMAAVASFFLYPTQSVWFHKAVTYFNKFEPVDGGNLQWSILLPALNGVVMTAISLLYANLISTTGTQLRNRQITVHQSLSTEVEGIWGLIQLLQYYPIQSQPSFGQHLNQYTLTLIDESYNTNPQDLRTNCQSLNDFRNQLHYLSTRPAAADDILHDTIRERSYETLQSILVARTTRITSLQTRFPALHYVTITALTFAILGIFLLETDRSVILYLDKFQLQSVWALLVGTVTAIYCIGVDLAYPFIGTYTVPADQLLENDDLLKLIDNAAKAKGDLTNQKFPLLEVCDIHDKPEEEEEEKHDDNFALYNEYMQSRNPSLYDEYIKRAQ